jgi:hypothetical protein
LLWKLTLRRVERPDARLEREYSQLRGDGLCGVEIGREEKEVSERDGRKAPARRESLTWPQCRVGVAVPSLSLKVGTEGIVCVAVLGCESEKRGRRRRAEFGIFDRLFCRLDLKVVRVCAFPLEKAAWNTLESLGSGKSADDDS